MRVVVDGENSRSPSPEPDPDRSIMDFAMSDRFHWARLLAFVRFVNQELLLRNEYHAAEIAKRLGRNAFKDIARVAKTDTILDWYRQLVAQKFDRSRDRAYPCRPRVSSQIEALVVRFARENRVLVL